MPCLLEFMNSVLNARSQFLSLSVRNAAQQRVFAVVFTRPPRIADDGGLDEATRSPINMPVMNSIVETTTIGHQVVERTRTPPDDMNQRVPRNRNPIATKSTKNEDKIHQRHQGATKLPPRESRSRARRESSTRAEIPAAESWWPNLRNVSPPAIPPKPITVKPVGIKIHLRVR